MMNKTVFAKTLSILIAAAMLLALLPAGFIVAHAESGWCGDNLTWNLDSAGRLSISGTGNMWDYYWDDPAPWGTEIISVTIGNSVTSIGDWAFENCTGLTSVTIPNSVTSIGWCAFAGCSGLISIGVISGNPVYYGAGNCLIERESKTLILGCKNCFIPSDGSVTSIGYGAFSGCTGLKSITIPNSVEYIESWAFEGCTGLTSVTIGNGVTSIGRGAFYGCTGLKSITIPDSVTTIDEDAFCDTGYYNTESNWQNDVLYIGNWLIKARDQITGHCSIKSGTVGIAGSAFWLGGYYDENDDEYYYYPGPSSVTIPDSVKYICWGAFCSCTELTSITIPDGVTIIDGSVFSDCTGLTSIMIPDGVTSIEDYAFSWCIGLTSITIPDSVTSIGEDAFWYCTGLTSVTIPNSVTYIGEDAFYYYDGDTEENEPLDVTLRVYNNSCAHWYAIDNGLNYELIDPPAVKGDMDGDGEITVADALKALRIAAKLVQPTEEDFAIGDVDGDGEITVADALKILRVAAKLATSWGGDEAKYKVALITDYGDVTDESFNQAAYEACREFCKENKIDFAYFKPTGDATEYRVAMIRRAISAGYNVIVMPGFAFGEAIPAVSGKYPDVKFIALDVAKSDLLEAGVAAAGEEYDYNPDNWDLDKYVYMDNVYCTTYREELSGYMAGYAAVKLGYTRLGFLGGIAVPSVVRYGYGFVQGADVAAAELGIYPEINYAYGGQFYGDMDITAVMDTWYQTGTEVVFACGGSIYSSAAKAAQKAGGKVIGVDVDQAAIIDGEYGDGMTVTSAMKGIKPSVTDALKAIINDKWDNYKGKVELLGLVSGTDVEANYCQIPYESTQWEDGRFTKEDYVTLVGRMFSGELRVSDDTTAMPAVTNVRVDDQGWIK